MDIQQFKFVSYRPEAGKKKYTTFKSSSGIEKSNSREVKKRSRNGCFTCRKRKKKCDESYPKCSGCEKNFLVCNWPEYRQCFPKHDSDDFIVTMAHSYRTDSNKSSPKPEENESLEEVWTYSEIDLEKKTSTQKEDSAYVYNDYSDINRNNLQISTEVFQQEPIGCPLFSMFDNSYSITDTSSKLTAFSTWIPKVSLSPESAFLYHIFVTQFIPSVSPQLTHPKLTPEAIFVPPGATSEVLREVFYTCAAAYLAWKKPEFKTISQQKYFNLVKMIKDELESGRADGSEDWLFVAVQCLCLREKCFGANASKSARHLAASFKIIRRRQEKRKAQRMFEQELEEIQLHDGNCFSFTDFLEEGRIEHTHKTEGNLVNSLSLYHNESVRQSNCINNGDNSEHFKLEAADITPTEKTLVESVIYNYSVSLLLCEESDLRNLPSPFQIFEEFKYFLEKPIYNCPTVWMNNSVLGAGIGAFEIAAKASWLSRLDIPLSDNCLKIAESLYKTACAYVPPHLSPEVESKVSYRDYKSLSYSLLVAACIAKASKILLRKTIHPYIKTNDGIIQESVSKIYEDLSKIPAQHFSNAISGWILVVAGACAVEEEHQIFFKQRCNDLGDALHVQFCKSILGFFDKAWGSHGKGCDILLDRESLEEINA